jgi:fatty-acyl-CoA synthase
VAPGEHVSVWLTNRPELLFLIYAVAKIGAVLVPLNTRYRSADFGFTIRHSNSATLILMDRSGPVDFLGMVRGLIPTLDRAVAGPLEAEGFPDLKRVIVLGAANAAGAIPWPTMTEQGARITDEELTARDAAVDPTALFLIAYTSGTTGDPKGVTHTHVCLRAIADHVERLGQTADDVVIAYLPIFHLYALSDCVLVSTMAGSTLVLIDSFDPAACVGLIEAERVTMLHGFDTHHRDLMVAQESERRDLSSLRRGTLAVGMASSVPIARRAQRELCPTVSGWGLTETWAFATMSYFTSSAEQRCEASGIAMPGYELRIVDPASGATLPPDTPGEILVRSYMNTPGYYRQPEATAQTIDAEGWLHTGDMGVLRVDGHLRFLGRYKDILKVGGENVSPAEVEAFVLSHPAVAQVAVVGYPDERLAEVPVAFVVRRANSAATTEADLIGHCRGRIAGFKVPRHVLFVDALPMTPTGKVQKFRLREMALALLAPVLAGA